MKSMLFAVLMLFALGQCYQGAQVAQASSMSSYLGNLLIYMLWVFSDAVCLAIGWGGIVVANDAGAVYNQCELAFIDWYSMLY